MNEAGAWCLIESDPGVLSELISDIGVKGVQIEEIYSLDSYSLSLFKPVYGLIFLFKWTGSKDNRPWEFENPNVFFARQVITNACATQAILSILLNVDEIDVGPELKEFKEFTKDFDAEMKGFAISNFEKIRTAHNSFSRAESLAIEDSAKGGKGADLFHFISYLPINGSLYELDGLKPGPINLGLCTTENWLEKAGPIIEERMAQYQQGSETGEIRFNLMALIKDRKIVSQQALESIQELTEKINIKLTAIESGAAMDTDDDLPSTADELRLKLEQLKEERNIHLDTVALEDRKKAKYKKENIRRKHNFIPLIYNLLTTLAEKDQLIPLIEKSLEKKK